MNSEYGQVYSVWILQFSCFTTVCSQNINKQNVNIADETLTDYKFLSRYHYTKSKNYLKRRYWIRHWIPMFIGTPCMTGKVWQGRYDREGMTGKVWQGSCDRDSMTGKVWQGRYDREGIKWGVWQGRYDKEGMTGMTEKVWQGRHVREGMTGKVWKVKYDRYDRELVWQGGYGR